MSWSWVSPSLGKAVEDGLLGGALDAPACGLGGIDGIGGIATDAANGIAATAKRDDGGAKGDGESGFGETHGVIPLVEMEQLDLSDAKRTSAEKVHVIACGAIAREVLAVNRLNGMDHIELQCLPAIWHAYPQKIAPGVEQAIVEARKIGATRIFIGYADCGTGGLLDEVCRRQGVERLSGPHCYSFFSGNDAFADKADDDITSFFLTDFLARQFEAFVIEPLGLDRHPQLRDMYFGNYRKVVYLCQEEDPVLMQKARAAAATLGLAFEYRFTGYGDLETELAAL